jgi:hypothetical protein
MTAGNPDQKGSTLLRSDDASTPNGNSAFDKADLVSTTAEASATEPSAITADQFVDDDALAVVAAISPEDVTNLEHMVDQLISATDLFDVAWIGSDGASDS